jgi:hypothetical protein
VDGRVWDILFGIFLVVCVLITPAAWVGYRNGQSLGAGPAEVVSVQLFDPAAPPVRAFTATPQVFSSDLDSIASAIPNPLPHPVWQGFLCDGDLQLTITLEDESIVTYGPCRYPERILPLYATARDAQTFGACRPDCGPNGTPGP